MICGVRAMAAVCLMLAAAPAVRAQAVRPVLSVSGTVRHVEVSRVVPSTLRVALVADATAQSSSRGVVTTSLSIAAGAVLGAWLGYFLSQVVKSDWEGMRTAEREGHRRRFAVSGAAVGAFGGFLIRPRRRAGRAEPPSVYVYVAPSERHYITRDELRRSIVVNGLEAVQVLRPEWLAGARSGTPWIANGAPATDGEIAVYVIDTRVGGPESLAEMSIPELEELRLYEPREAERRWGTAHPHGAIEVVPVGAQAKR